MQRMSFCIVVYVSGMLQSVLKVIVLITGTFGVVVVSKINTFSTVKVQVLLVGLVTGCLLR